MSTYPGLPPPFNDSKTIASKGPQINKKSEISSDNNITLANETTKNKQRKLPPVPKFGSSNNNNVSSEQLPSNENKKSGSPMILEEFKKKPEILNEDKKNWQEIKSTAKIEIGPTPRNQSPEIMQVEPVKPVVSQKTQKNSQQPLGPVPKEIKVPPPFVSDLSLARIQNLYASKQQQNQNQKVEETKAKPSSVSPAISIVNDNTPVQLHRFREEYDPARPNDYEVVMEERKKKQLEEEIKSISSSLSNPVKEKKGKITEKPEESNARSVSVKQTMDIENLELIGEEKSQEEKIINMLEKQGWKLGQGLGKHGQGMTTPLIAKKTTSNTAVIINSSVNMTSVIPAEVVWKKQIEQYYNMPPTRVIMLLGMVTPKDLDDSLRDEVIEECQNYGNVSNCAIVQINGAPEDQAVRVFIEFEKKEGAINAFGSLYGRFFAGRQVTVKFYDEKSFKNNQLNN